MKKVSLALVVAAALALSATASASSPASYRTQVNATCAKGVAQLNAIPKPSKASGYYAYFAKAVTMSDALLVKVAGVRPPASLAGLVAVAVSKQAAFERALHSLTAKLQTSSNPRKTVDAAGPTMTRLNNAANKAWRAAGLVKCAG